MEPLIGEVRLFSGNFAPRNWAFCEGQLMSISQSTALFAIIGTLYGGNGTSNFALPDLRGRTVMGSGTGPGLTIRGIGNWVGYYENRLLYYMLPRHTHTATIAAEVKVPVSSAPTATHSPTGAFLTVQNNNFYSTTTSGDSYGPYPDDFSGTPDVLASGQAQVFDIQQPFLNLRYIIALEGQFPARN